MQSRQVRRNLQCTGRKTQILQVIADHTTHPITGLRADNGGGLRTKDNVRNSCSAFCGFPCSPFLLSPGLTLQHLKHETPLSGIMNRKRRLLWVVYNKETRKIRGNSWMAKTKTNFLQKKGGGAWVSTNIDIVKEEQSDTK